MDSALISVTEGNWVIQELTNIIGHHSELLD